jgi:hypothetical protein
VKKLFSLVVAMMPLFLFGQNLGLGIILGSPTGFTVKYMMTSKSAIAVNAGWSLVEGAGFHCTGDYQFLFPTTLRWYDEFDETTHEIRSLTPYLGVGGRLLIKDDEYGDTDLLVGARIGGGIEYLFSRFGVFLELYPVVNIIPSTDFDFEGGLGLRFYL